MLGPGRSTRALSSVRRGDELCFWVLSGVFSSHIPPHRWRLGLELDFA